MLLKKSFNFNEVMKYFSIKVLNNYEAWQLTMYINYNQINYEDIDYYLEGPCS